MSRRELVAGAGASALFGTAIAATSKPIDEAAFPSIGGIPQWVAIRGADRSSPALLFLHGGPCEAQSAFRTFYAPWEQRYAVAQWDQRGAGRTFGKNGASTPDVSFDQLTHDAVEVSQYVRQRLRAKKLILVGHSWGAMLGLKIVRLRPDLFHAFVGTGQPVSGREILDSMRASAIARAQAAGDEQSVAALRQLTAGDLADPKKLYSLFRWRPSPFAGDDLDFLVKRGAMLGPPQTPSSIEAADFYASNPDPGDAGSGASCLTKLIPSSFEFDATADGYEVPVPFFVIQGSKDSRTPPEAARAFVDKVRAPAKNFTLIEGGHFACMSNPSGFLSALADDLHGLKI